MAARYVVPDAERMVSSRDAAPILGIHHTTIDKLAAKGIIPSYRIGRRVVLRVGDVFAFREERFRNLGAASPRKPRHRT